MFTGFFLIPAYSLQVHPFRPFEMVWYQHLAQERSRISSFMTLLLAWWKCIFMQPTSQWFRPNSSMKRASGDIQFWFCWELYHLLMAYLRNALFKYGKQGDDLKNFIELLPKGSKRASSHSVVRWLVCGPSWNISVLANVWTLFPNLISFKVISLHFEVSEAIQTKAMWLVLRAPWLL